MTEIEQHLYNNPELVELFLKNNKELLNEIKNRYASWLASGDLMSRFLMSKCLMETLMVTTVASKKLLQEEMREAGINVIDQGGNC